MSLASQTLRALAVVHLTAARLRRTGSASDLHLAARHDALEAQILRRALDEGLDTQLLLEELPKPGEQPPGEAPEEGDPSEETYPEGNDGVGADEELIEDLQHLECQECLDTMDQSPMGLNLPGGNDPAPIGAPLTTAGLAPRSMPEPAGGRQKAARKAARRKYLACSAPKLARAEDGRKVWMSICAYQQPPSKRVRMIAKIVSTNPSFPPREMRDGSGRRVPFHTEAEIDRLFAREST